MENKDFDFVSYNKKTFLILAFKKISLVYVKKICCSLFSLPQSKFCWNIRARETLESLPAL